MNDDFTQILNDITDRAKSFGAYLLSAQVAVSPVLDENEEDDDELGDMLGIELPASDDLKRQLIDGEIEVVMFTAFSLNEVAFSDRVQNPERAQTDDEFKAIMPTEYELLQEKIRQRLAEGKDLFDKDDSE